MKAFLIYGFLLAAFILAFPLITLGGVQNERHSEPLASLSVRESETDSQHRVYSDDFSQFKMLDITSGAVYTLSAREYVIGAVCAEMPASFESEALKAQAVAAYTYAVRQTLSELDNPTEELCGAYFSNDSTKYQAYYSELQAKQLFGENFDLYFGKISAAVDEVFEKLLVYDGEPIVAAFHSVSSGKTESAENVWGGSADYLVAVESASDIGSPKYLSEYVFTEAQMRTTLENSGIGFNLSLPAGEWFGVPVLSDSGTVTDISVAGKAVKGSELRRILGLASSNFEIAVDDAGNFKITCRGRGHGVGMSQYGANSMALEGKTFDEILAHYYVGASVCDIHDVFSENDDQNGFLDSSALLNDKSGSS